jgi:putative toxin-antitoxin system antitoxin component (TIGR02293 family)
MEKTAVNKETGWRGTQGAGETRLRFASGNRRTLRSDGAAARRYLRRAVRPGDTAWVKNELTAFTEDEIHHLVAPKRTFARRQANQQPLTVEETDKALRLARIAKLAQSVFGDAEKAGRWMRKPKQSLAGAAPLAYLASENGARLVEDMLYRIDAGFAF